MKKKKKKKKRTTLAGTTLDYKGSTHIIHPVVTKVVFQFPWQLSTDQPISGLRLLPFEGLHNFPGEIRIIPSKMSICGCLQESAIPTSL